MEWIIQQENLELYAGEIITYIEKGRARVIALYGPMGAGKTTLAKAIVKALGSSDTVSSPTFSIINHYVNASGEPVYHMDWYRLRDEEEAINAGVEDPLYSGYWCLVEWPEKAEALLPEEVVKLYVETLDRTTRKITIASKPLI